MCLEIRVSAVESVAYAAAEAAESVAQAAADAAAEIIAKADADAQKIRDAASNE